MTDLGDLAVADLLNKKSKTYKDKEAAAKDLEGRDLAAFLAENPKAMFRPLLTDGKRLVVGFKTGLIEEILT